MTDEEKKDAIDRLRAALVRTKKLYDKGTEKQALGDIMMDIRQALKLLGVDPDATADAQAATAKPKS